MRDIADHRTYRNVTEARYPGMGLVDLFFASLPTLQLWYERARQRHRLADLDDHLLRDIGIDRTAAMEEASKPFWRD